MAQNPPKRTSAKNATGMPGKIPTTKNACDVCAHRATVGRAEIAHNDAHKGSSYTEWAFIYTSIQ